MGGEVVIQYEQCVADSRLILGDCLSVLPLLDMQSVSMVFLDLPYGKTSNGWDIPIPLRELWSVLPRCTCIFTASNGFEYELYASNPKEYNYKWTWDKNNSAGFALTKIRPLNVTEDILIFRQSQYNPIKETRGKERKKGGYSSSTNYGIRPSVSVNNTYYPKSILHFSSACQKSKINSTQKPVELLEYLIETYTLPGETVLDPTAGSFTTSIACLNKGRRFVCIEKDHAMYYAGMTRVVDHYKEK